MATLGNILLVGTDNGFYTSTDYGSNWKIKRPTKYYMPVSPIIVIGREIIACFHREGVFRSNDTGATWLKADSGLTNNNIYSYVIVDSSIYVGTQGGGIFLSKDTGVSWMTSNHNLGFTTPNCFANIGSVIFTGLDWAGVAHTTDLGVNWNNTCTGIIDPIVTGLAVTGSVIYAGTSAGSILQSIDSGVNWVEKKTAYTRPGINSLISIGNIIIAGTVDSGILRSTDEGNTWNNLGLKTEINYLAANGAEVLASNGYEIYLSLDTGASWSKARSLPELAVGIIGINYFAGGDRGLFISTDKGNTWNLTGWTAATGDPNGDPILNDSIVFSMTTSGNNLIIGTMSYGIFLSEDLGNTWTNISTGLPKFSHVQSLHVANDYLFAGLRDYGVWRRPLSDFGISDVKTPTQSHFDFTLSPNPTTGIITVHNAPANITKVTVLNILGENVLEISPNASDFQLDLSKFPAGTYFARFMVDGKIISRKIVKE